MLYFFIVADKAACQTLSKAFLTSMKSMKIEVLLVLEVFITWDLQVEDLLCGAPSCSEACLFFSNNLFHLRLQSVQFDLQNYCAWVADKADVR